MKKIRSNWRCCILAGVIVITFLVQPGYSAEKYPSKPINFVCQWPAGGQTDTVMRILAPVLEDILGQPVPVTNKPGASGYIGFKSVSTAKPDGYTLGMIGTGLLLVQYAGKSKISKDEFTCIGQVYSADSFISVSTASPWKTIEEFIDYARKNPMKVKHGNSGYGASIHVYSELFAKAAGLKFAQIAYKGYAPAMVALAANEVDFTACPMVAVRPLMEAGKVRVLAIMADERSPEFPNVPTLKEKGINCSIAGFEGVAGPLGIPKEIVNVLEDAVGRALKNPSVKESYKKFDMRTMYRNGKDFKAYLDQEDKAYREVLKDIGFIK